MLRKRAVALAISMALSPAAFALGLGTFKTTSSLNQPFEGRIEILGAKPEDLDDLTIKLADAAQFERAGVNRSPLLLQLKFEIVTNPKGNDYIRVFTREVVREPFMDFLLELNWSQGRMVREYSALLDPPLYDGGRRQAVVPAPTPRQPQSLPPAAPGPAPVRAQTAPAATSAAAGGQVGPVQANDTLWALAQRSRPDPSINVQQMMVALMRANPDVFPDQNANHLPRGVILRMPTPDQLSAVSRQDALQEIRRQSQLWQEYRQGAARKPAPAAAVAPAANPPAAVPAARSETSARLEIAPVAPQKPVKPVTPAPGGGTGQLAEEQVATHASDVAELKARLDEAEGLIDLLQKQVQLKNDELAKLQGKAATPPATPAQKSAPVAPPAPTPAATTAAAPKAPAQTLDDTDDLLAKAAEEERAAAKPAEPAVPPPAAAKTETRPAPPAPAPAQPKPAEQKPVAKAPLPPAPTPAPQDGGPLEALIPAEVRELVPGGAWTVLGLLASLIALGGLALTRALSGRRVPPPVAKTFPDASLLEPTGSTLPPATPGGLELVDESDVVFDPFSRTIEASTAELAPTDPLEEVNVYLAYERFDQAEELVKKVIAKHPGEPKYLLRLLEIYYSANNLASYESAARELKAAVGEDSELWQNALAMWNEMSPQRALFAPGALPEAAPATPAREFVDLTAGAPRGAETSNALDFDLGADTLGEAPAELGGDTVGHRQSEEARDLQEATAAVVAASVLESGMEHELATTSPGATAARTEEQDLFDITGGDDSLPQDPGSLLNLTSSADVFERGARSLPSTPGAGLADTATGSGLGLEHAASAALDLDFSGSEAVPEFDLDLGAEEAEPTPVVPDDLSLELEPAAGTANVGALELDESGADAMQALDFDIAGLELDSDGTDATTDMRQVLSDTAGMVSTADETADLDLDLSLADTGADFDLSGLSDEMAHAEEAALSHDLTLHDEGEELSAFSTLSDPAAAGDDSALEFDLSLQDTTDFDRLEDEGTLELPDSASIKSQTVKEESLDDLTRSLEASLAGLDLNDDEPAGEAVLDLESLAGGDVGGLDFDFSLDEPDSSTKAITVENGDDLDITLERTGIQLDRGALQPSGEAALPNEDEADSKLNLARAYLELGEHASASSILQDVVKNGSSAQQEEARRLLTQIA